MLMCPTKAEARRICKLMTLAGPAAVRASKELVMGVAYRPIDDELIQYTADWLAKVRADDESVSEWNQSRRAPSLCGLRKSLPYLSRGIGAPPTPPTSMH